MCFIDPQKTYDPIHRLLLWELLARIGVPLEVIAVVCQCHDGHGLDHVLTPAT